MDGDHCSTCLINFLIISFLLSLAYSSKITLFARVKMGSHLMMCLIEVWKILCNILRSKSEYRYINHPNITAISKLAHILIFLKNNK